MTAYTIHSGATYGLANSGNSGYIFGVQFSVSQSVSLTGILWYTGSGQTGLPTACALYNANTQAQISGTLNSSPSWSGAAGSGWVTCTYSGPTLSTGINYVAVLYSNTAKYAQISAYWTSGGGASGITNGPLTAPSSAASVNGQMTYASGGSIAFPTSTVSGYDFGVDVQVTTTAAAALPGPLVIGQAVKRGAFY